MRHRAPSSVPPISPLMWRWFSWYAGRFLRKHFHAVRLMHGGAPPSIAPDEPLIVYCNHPSWWDPMVGIFLARRFWPSRRHYWPIDATMLRHYPVFRQLGFFGVEKGTARGAATFLRVATAALSRPGACLWITAQGDFADVRLRPVRMKPGLSHLARRLSHGVILPLAGEYPFWTERTPEALVRFGRPLQIAERLSHDQLELELVATMDALAGASMSRDPSRFSVLASGAAGASPFYDAWRWTRATASGRAFYASHAPDAQDVQDERRAGLRAGDA